MVTSVVERYVVEAVVADIAVVAVDMAVDDDTCRWLLDFRSDSDKIKSL